MSFFPSFGFNKSSSNSGYYDKDTQNMRDWFKNYTVGTEQDISNPNYNANWQSNNPYSKNGVNKFGVSTSNQYDQWMKDHQNEGEKTIKGGRSGGLIDKFSQFDPTVFSGDGKYQTTDFGDSTYSANNFSAPLITDQMFGSSKDMIANNLNRAMTTNLQKAQDNAAYQGRGGGDLAEWRAGEANRSLESNLADSTRQLAEKRLGMNYEGNKWQQEMSDRSQQAAEAAKLARLQNTEASKQFGAGHDLDYAKSKLQELIGNKDALLNLLNMISQQTAQGQKGASSSSIGMNFGGSAK